MNRMFSFRASSFPVSPGRLGPLEQRLLEALWKVETATVRELLDHGYSDLAYTTVMTTLDRLYKKNFLTRSLEFRAYRYTPKFTREQLNREVACDAFRRLLDSSPAASLPLSYLVEVLTERDTQLLDDLSQLVEAKRRELRDQSVQKEALPKEALPKERLPEE